jgi:hypothetical protein
MNMVHYLTVGVSIWTDLLFPAATFYTLKRAIIVLRMETFVYMTALTPTFLTEAFSGVSSCISRKFRGIESNRPSPYPSRFFPIHLSYSLAGGSAHRKATTYTNTE